MHGIILTGKDPPVMVLSALWEEKARRGAAQVTWVMWGAVVSRLEAQPLL